MRAERFGYWLTTQIVLTQWRSAFGMRQSEVNLKRRIRRRERFNKGLCDWPRGVVYLVRQRQHLAPTQHHTAKQNKSKGTIKHIRLVHKNRQKIGSFLSFNFQPQKLSKFVGFLCQLVRVKLLAKSVPSTPEKLSRFLSFEWRITTYHLPPNEQSQAVFGKFYFRARAKGKGVIRPRTIHIHVRGLHLGCDDERFVIFQKTTRQSVAAMWFPI